VTDGVLSPLTTLANIAAHTERVRIGTLVCNNDFRHPAVLAREAATLDLLSGGRLELGIGAGHAAPEYDEIGLPFDPPAVRVERLEEAVGLLCRLFDGERVAHAGAHYRLHDHALWPPRRPRLLVGGNGDRVLRLAAEHADIAGFTGLGRTLADGQHHEPEWDPVQIDAKVATFRNAAGDRAPDIECNALVQHIEITDDRNAAATRIGNRLGTDPEVLLSAPYLLLGTVDEIVPQLVAARARWGFSYFVTRDAVATAPVIAAARAVDATGAAEGMAIPARDAG
jgi:probable F420-dependent oxidoreductase